MFEKLKKYKEVPKTYEEDPKLGRWVALQQPE